MYITCAKKNKTKLIYKIKVIYITSPIQSYVSVALTLWKKEKERRQKALPPPQACQAPAFSPGSPLCRDNAREASGRTAPTTVGSMQGCRALYPRCGVVKDNDEKKYVRKI